MATEKSFADLLQDLIDDIESAVDDDSITPEILFQRLSDIIKSCWNKVDGITIKDIAPPTLFALGGNFPVAVGDQLNATLQKIMNAIDANFQIINSDNVIQGRAGLFLATADPDNQQIIDSTSGSLSFDVVIPNDNKSGGFDNGNNWSTYNYKNLNAPFTGKFVLSAIELELLKAPTVGPASVAFKLKNESGATLATSTGSISMGTADAVGTKYYAGEANTGAITVAQTTGLVKVVCETSGTFNNAVFRINQIWLRNED